MDLDENYKRLTIVLTLFVFFVPQKDFAWYYSLVIPMFFGVIFVKKDRNLSYLFEGGVALLVICFCYSVAKFFLFGNFYDFKELVKPLLFILAVGAFYQLGLTLRNLENAALVFIVCDLSFSIFQFIGFESNTLNLLSSLYSTQNHIETALFDVHSVRALGFSPGPAQHGVISIFIFWFFTVLLFWDRFNVYRLIGCTSSLVVLMLTQSKTVYIAFVVSSFLFLFLLLIHGKINKRDGVVFCFLLFLIIICFYKPLLDNFSELDRLLKVGLSISSLSARFELWGIQVGAAFDKPFLMFFGVGRSYLEHVGVYHNSFDNDFVYMFISYGVLGFVFSFLFLISYIFSLLLCFEKANVLDQIFLMTIFSGFISSLGVAYFIDLKMITMFAMLFALKLDSFKGQELLHPVYSTKLV